MRGSGPVSLCCSPPFLASVSHFRSLFFVLERRAVLSRYDPSLLFFFPYLFYSIMMTEASIMLLTVVRWMHIRQQGAGENVLKHC